MFEIPNTICKMPTMLYLAVYLQENVYSKRKNKYKLTDLQAYVNFKTMT